MSILGQDPKVLESHAGYYLGTADEDGDSVSRAKGEGTRIVCAPTQLVCVARVTKSGTQGIARTPAMYLDPVAMIRGLSRRARRQPRVQSYSMDDSFVAIEYDPAGVPIAASVTWLADHELPERDMLTLLDDVWRAATLAAAA